MLFNSISYLLFFPLVVVFYFLLPGKLKKSFLLAASLFFYSCWNVKYTLLMVLSILVTYATGLLLDKSQDETRRKVFVFFCFLINLGILFLFKYANFAIQSLNFFAGVFHMSPLKRAVDFLLPVGISFYTFQALGYTLDVYRRELPAEKNLIQYGLFVSFFPQLVAGPIERSVNLLPQLKRGGTFAYENLVLGGLDLAWGYFLKLVLADRVAIFVNEVFGNLESFSGFSLLMGAVFFTLQIYCDFYSYSLIAKGSAKILGIDLMDNFKEPLLSKSIVEFWRRWHISLSSWFRDYLYIPLGGSRVSLGRNLVNILIVFGVSGLWHGAEMSFVLWGLIHGFFNSLEVWLKKTRAGRKSQTEGGSFILSGLKRVYTFSIVVLAFVFFRADNISQGLAYIGQFFRAHWGVRTWLGEVSASQLGMTGLYPILGSLLVLTLVDGIKYRGYPLRESLAKGPFVLRWVLVLLLIVATLIFGVYGPGYSESQFIYFQF